MKSKNKTKRPFLVVAASLGWFTAFTSAIAVLAEPALVFAQRSRPDPTDGCAACGAGMTVMIAIPIFFIVLNIALLIWVARDAKARGMDSAVIWMALVMFTSLLGLLIYIFSRPQGSLIRCTQCGNSRMQASAKCPHCGNA